MILFALSIFLSAFLLFLVQPLIARVILPWFGGSAAVWTTCLMFFQVTLLAGYAYAHATIKFLRPKAQAALHWALLAVSLVMLPILPGAAWKPLDGSHPGLRIVALLAGTVGLPYLVLSTTGPLLQAWYARKYPGASPYRLYALSNAGSLIALLSYPVVIEPLSRLRFQAYGWSTGYVLFAILCAVAAWVSREAVSAHDPESPVAAGDGRPGLGIRLLWVGLAFCPSTLLIGITSHLTENVAPVPLLWIVPLALYLISFILTFESDRWYGRRYWFPLFIAAMAVLIAFLFPDSRHAPLKYAIPTFILCFFICAMTCHGELYALRPAPRWLTSFYLMVSLGGALGGVFVGLISPVAFNNYLELPIGLLITAALMGLVLHRAEPSLPGPAARWVEYGLVAALACGLIYLLAWANPHWYSEFLLVKRNFYGVVRVEDNGGDGETEEMRELHHGTISHGTEYKKAEFHRIPTTYYAPTSGIGIALKHEPGTGPRRVAVIGLGAGTISAYGQPGDFYRFYEINPDVVEIARNQFFFLKECPAQYEIAMGDARLSLEREQPQRYDVMAVDAFSGDAIPIHLLTLEAFKEYFRHLAPAGILAVHVSNRFLDLGKVVSRSARELNKAGALIVNDDDGKTGAYSSDWVILVNDPAILQEKRWQVGSDRFPLPQPEQLWTDDYSNLIRILK